MNLAHIFEHGSGAARIGRVEADVAEDRCARIGPPARSAYEPSGAPGRSAMLFLTGAWANLAALAVAAPCAAGVLMLDEAHRYVPGLSFAPPVILALALATAVLIGVTVGTLVARGVQPARCRQPHWAGFCAIFWTVVAFCLLPLVGQLLTSADQSFICEHLLPLARRAVIGTLELIGVQATGLSASHDWLACAGAVLCILAGAATACHMSQDRVRALPFCERCRTYHETQTLWQIPAIRADAALGAFDARDYDAIVRMPYCRGFRHHLNVQVQACLCGAAPIVEIAASREHPGRWRQSTPPQTQPVRIFSRTMTPEQTEHIRRCGWGYRPLEEAVRPAKVA